VYCRRRSQQYANIVGCTDSRPEIEVECYVVKRLVMLGIGTDAKEMTLWMEVSTNIMALK